MKKKNLTKFANDRVVYGTLGAIQKYFKYHDVPEDWTIEMLGSLNVDLSIRVMESMYDEDLVDLIDGVVLAYYEFHIPEPTPV